MNKTLKIIIGIIFVILLLPVIIVGMLYIRLSKGISSNSTSSPRTNTSSSQIPPKITYAEFPFKLVYEIKGERVTVEDTLICEFDGWNEVWTKHLEWKSYLASNKDEDCVQLLELEDHTKIYYTTYKAGYHMGFVGRGKNVNNPFNVVFAEGPSSSELHAMGMTEMLEYLDIVLIEWEIAPPIENEFPKE